MAREIIVARIRARAGKGGAFYELAARTVVPATRAEEGNLSYTLYRSVEEPDRLIYYEEYRNAAAVEAHRQSEHLRAFLQASAELVESRSVERFEA